MTKHSLIIGAGLAGLATGYTLTKAGHKVTIIEKESYPGGRVRSLPIDGHMVDFGGFIIYPWYKQYHRLIKELGLKKQLRDIPLSTVYYELEKDVYTPDNKLSFPITDMAKLYAKTLPKMIRYQMDIAKPALHIFKNQSVAEYIRETLEINHAGMYETFSDIVCQGYCYGPVTQYKMAVVAPVVLNTTFRGNLKDSVYFFGNNGLFAYALADYITSHGGEIKYNEEVTELKQNELKTTTQTYTADSIICASRINKTLLSHVAPNIPVDCPYTKFYNTVIKCDVIPQTNGADTWGAVFYLPDITKPLQILSSVNVREMLGGETNGLYINLNIIDRTNKKTLSNKELQKQIQEDVQRIFPNVQSAEVVESIHWTQTMPIAEESFIESIRKIQGNNNVWFAGDYLGSPSMETALQTGIIAAKEILKTI
jgi:protoporphyrinogen oxidase